MAAATSDRFRRWARLSFHYPGLTPQELAVLPNAVLDTYEQEIPRLIAEQQSIQLDVISFPHMDKAGQKKVIRSLERRMGMLEAPEMPSTTDKGDIKTRARQAGIGMVFE